MNIYIVYTISYVRFFINPNISNVKLHELQKVMVRLKRGVINLTKSSEKIYLDKC